MTDILNAPETTSDPQASSLGSMWAGVNPHLIARFRKIVRDEEGKWIEDEQSPELRAGLVESHMEVGLTWTSAFESSGTESQAPALTAMLQTNALAPVVKALVGAGPIPDYIEEKSTELFNMFQGRTGITKLNSTQVFTGMPPIKITGQLVLRAWRNAADEVEAPLAQLMDWVLPQELSKDGSVIARTADAASGKTADDGKNSLVNVLMPSIAPTPINMVFKGRRFEQMVIESVGIPLDSPIDRQGNFVFLRMPVTITTLTARDKSDWQAMRPV